MPAAPVDLIVHRLRTGRVLAYVWLVFVGFAAVDIVKNWDGGAYKSGLLVLVASLLLTYVVGLRPAVLEQPAGLVVRNPLRNWFVPWGALTDVDFTDVLRLHTSDQVVRCFAVTMRTKPARPPGSLTSGVIGGITSGMKLPGIDAPKDDGSMPSTAPGAGAVARRLQDMAPRLASTDASLEVTHSLAPDALAALALALVLVLVAVL